MVDDDGNPYCEDGYFAILKSAEVQEYLQNIAQEAGVDIKVIVSLKGNVGKKYNKDTTVEEMLSMGEEIEVNIFGYMKPETTEEQFEEQTTILQKKFEKTGFYMDYVVWRLLSNEKFDYIQTYSDIDFVFQRGVISEEDYDLRVYKYIKPSK